MGYNIYFELAAVFFVVILLMYQIIRYPNASVANRRFRQMTEGVLVTEILDIVSALAIDNGTAVLPLVNTLLSTAYFASVALCGYCYMRYLNAFVNKEGKMDKFILIHYAGLCLYLLFLLLNIPFGYCFEFDVNGQYIHNGFYEIVYVVPCYFLLFGEVYLFFHKECMEKYQRYATYVFVAFVVIGEAIQVLLFPNILLSMYSTSLAIMAVLFSVETPDYQKLVSTMNKLELSRQEAEEAKQRATNANKAKSVFLAQMSHEIRTPINSIIGMNEVILREGKEPQIHKYAGDIKSSAYTLLSIINDILDLSKVESGKMEIVPVEYSVSGFLRDIINMISVRAKEKKLYFDIRISEDLPAVLYGDDIRIRQVLVNLLTNAVKYTQEGTVTLVVEGERSENHVNLHFEVKDTGIGISQEDMPKLFADYERMDKKQNHGIEGTGLGLSIVTKLLELMNSELFVESEKGKGSVFSFDLEQEIVDTANIGDFEEQIRQVKEDHSYKATFQAENARILLVDDNDLNRKVFRELLKQTKVKITDVASGRECLQLIVKHRYDIIFLDHMMPDMDGIEVLHRMKEMGTNLNQHVPVVMLTANAGSGARESYIEEGFQAFLAKPIIPDQLERMVRELLPEHLLQNGADAKKNAKWHVMEEELPHIPEINWEYAQMHFPDVAILREIAREFYKSIDEEIQEIEDLVDLIAQRRYLDEFRVCVHGLKSTTAMIGALQISSLARMLEVAAQEENYGRILSLTPILIDELRRHKTQMAVLDLGEENREPANMLQTFMNLEMLQISLGDNDYDQMQHLIEELQKYSYEEGMQEMINILCSQVKNLDIALAKATISRILVRFNAK